MTSCSNFKAELAKMLVVGERACSAPTPSSASLSQPRRHKPRLPSLPSMPPVASVVSAVAAPLKLTAARATTTPTRSVSVVSKGATAYPRNLSSLLGSSKSPRHHNKRPSSSLSPFSSSTFFSKLCVKSVLVALEQDGHLHQEPLFYDWN